MSTLAKHERHGGPRAVRITAGEILGLLTAEHRPLDWRELVRLVGADSPQAITRLRKVLKGLERNEEIERDHLGAYHVPGTEPVREAIVRQTGKRFHAAGLLIEDADRFSLREGDAIEMRVVGERARVLRVISHADTPVTGILQWRGKHPHVVGLGAYRGRVSLLERPTMAADGDTVRVRIVDRDRRGLVGVVLDVIAADSVLDQAIRTAVAGGGIPDEWPRPVLDAAAALPDRVVPGRYASRVDLQSMALVTIDGETARDFDDAVFVEALPGRRAGWRLVVAIADVAHYVKPGSALDVEALQRGTSVYFPERVIPMLPEAISNNLCSLRPAEPRLAMVCDMRIDNRGEVRDFEFYEGIIFSHARLTYEQVEAFLGHGAPLPVEEARQSVVAGSMQALAALHAAMREARERRGALDFATREGEVRTEHGQPVAVLPVRRLRAHQLIEEAMIAANVCAAVYLERHDQPSLYRVHEPPEADKLEELRQALSYAGVRMAKGAVAPGALQAALARLPDTADAWLYAQLALRSLQQARYSPDNQGHYGLALEHYMHFTSPIRRYPDLLVHRAIKAQLQPSGRQRPPGMDELVQLGESCSHSERRAESASWLVDGWLKCHLLLDRVGDTMNGVVAGVTEFGLFVELEGHFVQGLLHISNLGADYFQFHARSLSLVGERSGRRFALGDRLRVQIAGVEPPQGKIDLQLQGGGGRSTRRKSTSGKRR